MKPGSSHRRAKFWPPPSTSADGENLPVTLSLFSFYSPTCLSPLPTESQASSPSRAAGKQEQGSRRAGLRQAELRRAEPGGRRDPASRAWRGHGYRHQVTRAHGGGSSSSGHGFQGGRQLGAASGEVVGRAGGRGRAHRRTDGEALRHCFFAEGALRFSERDCEASSLPNPLEADFRRCSLLLPMLSSIPNLLEML